MSCGVQSMTAQVSGL